MNFGTINSVVTFYKVLVNKLLEENNVTYY